MAKIHESVFQAKGSVVLGDVEMGADCGVWYGAVIRGDEDSIRIGSGSNFQDNAVLHVDTGYPMVIGDGVTVGHGAILHGCSVGDNTVIGMGAIVLNTAKIGKNCIIGAGALVPGGMEIPDGSIAFGNPAKIRREVTEDDIRANRENAEVYVELAREAKKQDS